VRIIEYILENYIGVEQQLRKRRSIILKSMGVMHAVMNVIESNYIENKNIFFF
jgi:hypothetical protein